VSVDGASLPRLESLIQRVFPSIEAPVYRQELSRVYPERRVTSFNSFSAPRDVKDGKLISFRANVEDRPKDAVGPM